MEKKKEVLNTLPSDLKISSDFTPNFAPFLICPVVTTQFVIMIPMIAKKNTRIRIAVANSKMPPRKYSNSQNNSFDKSIKCRTKKMFLKMNHAANGINPQDNEKIQNIMSYFFIEQPLSTQIIVFRARNN